MKSAELAETVDPEKPEELVGLEGPVESEDPVKTLAFDRKDNDFR